MVLVEMDTVTHRDDVILHKDDIRKKSQKLGIRRARYRELWKYLRQMVETVQEEREEEEETPRLIKDVESVKEKQWQRSRSPKISRGWKGGTDTQSRRSDWIHGMDPYRTTNRRTRLFEWPT